MRTVDSRLKGTWVITRVNIDGNDVTGVYGDSLNGQALHDFKIEIGGSDDSRFSGVIKSNRSATFFSLFNETKGKIYWNEWTLMSGVHEKPDSLNLKVFRHLLVGIFSVDRLYRKDLWIEGSINNSKYEIDFKKNK